ncbi:diguanylate cyclase [Undibacterium sp. Ren11W]|uniref:diguanylate cyclase n=1 Tax=Undibacterium sp. Ren11W TaxID=3413045 RepID=UPI003BF1548D
MDDKQESLQDALRALNQIFAEKLPSKLQEIDHALSQFTQHPEDKDALALLHRLLHTMSGSAGTFGFDELGQQSRKLEVRIKPLLSGTVWSDVQLSDFSNEVREYLSHAMSAKPVVDVDEDAEVAQEVALPHKAADVSAPRLIYVVDEDSQMCEAIAVQLRHFGYELVILNAVRDLAPRVAVRMPDVILINLGFSDEQFAGALEIEKIRLTANFTSKVLFTSNSSRFESRLRAVRSGGDGYFTKPVDISLLIENIDFLVRSTSGNGYRILIVDDDLASSEYQAKVLSAAHMSVEVLNNPAQLFNVMAQFRPELILMDVYMPLCGGVELAKMVRQDNSFLDIPIVFLSTENDFAKQLDAVKAGADDFLTKPIHPEFLVSSISTRAERYRSLRTLIMRDGLTGLYNHTAIKEELIAEVSMAVRNKTPLAVAMLDLDNFKLVNDNYGHPVGDQVLRTLSRLLRQRLRRSDVVGRYGGEEFIVIFPATSATSAMTVLDEVRIAFAKLQQFSDQGEFAVTFSAGISDLSRAADVNALIENADAALYMAKKSGKNRIVLGQLA